MGGSQEAWRWYGDVSLAMIPMHESAGYVEGTQFHPMETHKKNLVKQTSQSPSTQGKKAATNPDPPWLRLWAHVDSPACSAVLTAVDEWLFPQVGSHGLPQTAPCSLLRKPSGYEGDPSSFCCRLRHFHVRDERPEGPQRQTAWPLLRSAGLDIAQCPSVRTCSRMK